MSAAQEIRRLELILASPFWQDKNRRCVIENVTFKITGHRGITAGVLMTLSMATSGRPTHVLILFAMPKTRCSVVSKWAFATIGICFSPASCSGQRRAADRRSACNARTRATSTPRCCGQAAD